MDSADVGSKRPDASSGPHTRWTPVVTWLLSVTSVPIVILALVWAHDAIVLPFIDSGGGVLDRIVPPVALLAFAVCRISIWSSSATVWIKILATLATVPLLIVAIMMALAVLFWGFVSTSM